MDKQGEAEHAKMLEETREIRESQFTREELWGLISRAGRLAGNVPNPEWRRAYEDLRHAASTLDAFLARSTVHVSSDKPN